MKSVLTSFLGIVALLFVLTGLPHGLRNHFAFAQAVPSGTPSAGASPVAASDLITTLTNAGQFTTLLKAVQTAGLTDQFKTGGPYTVFAPNDAAFAKLPPTVLQSVLANPDLLKQSILYHAVAGELSSDQLKSMGQVTTIEGASLTITPSDGSLKVGNATVIQPDVKASNGVIHVVDSVLQLPVALPGASPSPGAAASPSA